jgi:hypothetical protein
MKDFFSKRARFSRGGVVMREQNYGRFGKTGNKTGKKMRSFFWLGLAMILVPLAAMALSLLFSQGFETDTSGWFDSSNGGNGTVNRVPSGYSSTYASGIDSAAGNYHARLGLDSANTCNPGTASCVGPYTYWGTPHPGVPVSAYGSVTELDIYLDTNFAASNADYRFDWDSALSDSQGNFLQDYIFNAGTANPSIVPGCAPADNAYFVISASTNSQRGSAYPQNPGKTPQCITQSGWYTFRHTFRPDSAGNLEVDMDILDSNGATVASWILHPTCMGTQATSGLCTSGDPLPFTAVGYNRYGWLPDQEIADLAIDNTFLSAIPQTMDDCKQLGWQSLGFKNQGQCVAFVVSHSSKH